MNAILLRPPETFQWDIRPPGSKSITNRALALAAISKGRSQIRGWLDADDTRHMRACLDRLNIPVHEIDGVLEIEGAGGRIPKQDAVPELFVGTAGTVARFLLPILAASTGQTRIDGTPRMRERPMEMLIEGLRAQGARIVCEEEEGFLPVTCGPNHTGLTGGEIRLSRPASSQFVSGLVISACLANTPTTIVLEQGTPARPYIDMTLTLIRAFGGSTQWETQNKIVVQPIELRAQPFVVEPDASAASYPLALAAIYRGQTTIEDLGAQSIQGDIGLARLLGRFGAHFEQDDNATTVRGIGQLKGQELDLSDMPDMTLTLAVVAMFAAGPTKIRGVSILRHHESDRLAAAATELRKLGAQVTEHADGLDIVPPATGPKPGIEIDTYDDHRMAMAFSLVGDVIIRDPGCVGKTYPEYFNDLGKIGMVAGKA